MGNNAALTPVSYVVLRRADEVLLQLRQGTGYLDGHWSAAAAGHVEAEESASGAAIREAFEELGVSIAAEDLFPLTAMHRSQRSGTTVEGRMDFFFTCATWTGTPRIMEPEKASDLAWFRLDELPEQMVPHERFVLGSLAAGLPAIVNFGFGGTGTAD